jgi:hypothetical protein
MNNLAYTEAAAQLDAQLDRNLATLRQRQEADEISVRQAADLRVAILTEHVAALAALRVEHFGNDDPAGRWNSGASTP